MNKISFFLVILIICMIVSCNQNKNEELSYDNEIIQNALMSKDENEIKEAIEYLNNLIKSEPKNPSLYINKIALLIKLDNYDDSLIALDKLLTIKPNFAEAYVLKGIIYENKNKRSKALDCYNRAMNIYKQKIKDKDLNRKEKLSYQIQIYFLMRLLEIEDLDNFYNTIVNNIVYEEDELFLKLLENIKKVDRNKLLDFFKDNNKIILNHNKY